MKVLILGAGPAGVSVAEELRKMGFQGEIEMLTAEPFPPYSPPVLADYLETEGKSDTVFWKGKNFDENTGVHLRVARAVGLKPRDKTVILENGESIAYQKLVIATGSRMWVPVECQCKEKGKRERFYNFKSLTAVNKLLDELKRGAEKAVVIGAGFIGVEIAITLRKMGLEVTVVEMMNRILPRMVDEKIARPLEKILIEKGINLKLNSKGKVLEGGESAEKLILEDGTEIKADLFIAATGIRPNVEFLKDSGLEVGRGLKVNEYLQAGPDIYAGGDVVEVKDIITGNVYPHAIYPAAIEQAKIIAANIMGERITYPGALNMNSLHHFDLPLISEGAMEGETEPDEEIYLEKEGNVKRVLLKNERILRYELLGDKKGSGILHWITERRLPFGPFRDAFVRGRLNTAFKIRFLP